MQDVGGEAFFLAQEPQQEMLGSDVLVVEPLGLLRAIRQHALALMAQRQVDGSRHFFAQRGVRLDLLTNGFDGRARTEEAVGQRLIFPQQSQQQVFGFDTRTAELAGFITGKKDYTARFFGITFKHDDHLQ